MSAGTLSGRLQGRQTQFHIELLYGVLFIAGFGYLVFRIDPRVAAVEEQVADEVEQQVEAEIGDIDDQIDERVTERLDEAGTEPDVGKRQ